MADETMKLVAEVVDKYSGPLREMNKAFRSLQSNIKGTHATGTAQAKEQAKANQELHRAIEKVRATTTAFTPALAAVGITALSVGGAITGLVASLKSLGDSSQSLTFLSRRTKLTTDELRTFEEMGERVGVSSDTMASGLANFGQFMDENTRRVPAAVEKWKALRGSFEGLGASLRGLSRTDQIHRVFDFLPKIHDMDQRRKLLTLLGLPEDLANASREELAKAERAATAYVKAHPLDIGKGLKAKEAFLDLHEAIEGLKTDLSVEFAPGLTKTIKGLSAAVELAGKGILKLEEIIDHFKKNDLTIDLTPEKGSWLDSISKYLHDPDRGKKLIDKSIFGPAINDMMGGPSNPEQKKSIEEGTKKGTFDGLLQFFQLQSYQPPGGGGGLPVVKASYNPGGGVGGGSRFSGGGRGGDINLPAGTGPDNSGGGVIDRARFAKELENNPALRNKVMAIAAGENNNTKANISVMETMMNRAAMAHTSLAAQARTVREGGYYAGYNPGALRNAKQLAILQEHLRTVLGGSNVSNYATDNSSQGLAAREKATGKFRLQSEYGGESFFSPGWGGGHGGGRSREAYERWRGGVDKPALALRGDALRHHFGHPSQHPTRDLWSHAQRAGLMGGSQKVVGDASLKIDLNGFPKGTRTKMAYGGMFRDVKLNRGSPMALASEEA